MKTGQIVGSIVGGAVLTAAAVGVCFFMKSSTTDIGGTPKNTVFTRSLVFDGDEIESVEALCDELSRFQKLDTVDLGSFAVDAQREEELRGMFPDTEMIFDTYVTIFGERFPSGADEIDVSSLPIKDESALIDKLAYFKDLKRVSFGGTELPADVYEALEERYPKIEFIGTRLFGIGKTMLREDTTQIDFADIAVGKNFDYEDLAASLEPFTLLEKADLTSLELSMEDKYAIVGKYPDVRFTFPVEVLDTVVDSGIETLDVSKKRIDDLEAFERTFTLFPNLKVVDMCDCGLSNEEMAEIRERHPGIKIVWRIHMGKWSLRTDAVAFSVLIYHYDYRRLTAKDIEVLKYCTDLRALDLGHQAINDISVIGDYLPELRLLILADNLVHDLSPLTKCKHLHYLEFFVDRVTDLSPLAECKELVDLNISYNYGIRDITPLLDLPMLERLWLESTAVSAADVQLLRDTYPDAKIVNIGSGSIDQGWRTHKRYYDMLNMFLYHTQEPMPESFTMYG